MKTVKLKLKDSKAIIIDKVPTFIEKDDKVEFIIMNPLGLEDKLSYITNVKSTKVEGNSFTLDYNEILDNMYVRIILNNELFILRDLKVHDIKVIDNTVSPEYLDIVANMRSEIEDLKLAVIHLFEEFFKIMKKDVIE